MYQKMANFVKMFVILICLTGALSASILAVTPRDKARQLNSIIDKRKEIPDLPNGVATVLQMVIGWMAALIPADLVTWVLGRDLVVADVLLMETMIEDVVKVYSMWSR